LNFLQRHAYDIGSGFARLLLPFFGRRIRLATENVMRCGVETDERRARELAKRSLRHLVGHICEALCVPGVVNARNWREHIDPSGASEATARLLLDPPQEPIILASSHHGTWEPATNILSLVRPMIAIARVQNNRFAAWWMKRYHFRGPVTIIDKNHGMSAKVLKQWRDEKAAMTILMDQHAHGGLKLDFLGRPARTYTSVARLAIRTGYPVVIGSFVRIAPYRYRMVGGDPIRFEKGADLAKATQLLNDRLGEAIRQYPEQYLWVHRRWRDD